MFEKCFLQYVRHTLRDAKPNWGGVVGMARQIGAQQGVQTGGMIFQTRSSPLEISAARRCNRNQKGAITTKKRRHYNQKKMPLQSKKRCHYNQKTSGKPDESPGTISEKPLVKRSGDPGNL